jgi:hypothetical protein
MMNHTTACAHEGPYRKGVNTARWKLRGRLLCNRPAGHDEDGGHVHYTAKLLARWTGAGAPVSVVPAYGVAVVQDA